MYYSKSYLGNNSKKHTYKPKIKAGSSISKMFRRKHSFKQERLFFIILERVNGEIHTSELFASLQNRQGTRTLIYVAFPEGPKPVLLYILLQLSPGLLAA